MDATAGDESRSRRRSSSPEPGFRRPGLARRSENSSWTARDRCSSWLERRDDDDVHVLYELCGSTERASRRRPHPRLSITNRVITNITEIPARHVEFGHDDAPDDDFAGVKNMLSYRIIVVLFFCLLPWKWRTSHHVKFEDPWKN